MDDHETILIPTDGSPGAQIAVDHAVSLARMIDATVHILYVVDTRLGIQAEVEEAVWEELDASGHHIIDTVMEDIQDDAIDVVGAVRKGAPHEEILAYAAEHAIDLIVMGTRGSTDASPLGSVTEKVLRHADRPVVTVPRED